MLEDCEGAEERVDVTLRERGERKHDMDGSKKTP